jgi:hypothetical protein
MLVLYFNFLDHTLTVQPFAIKIFQIFRHGEVPIDSWLFRWQQLRQRSMAIIFPQFVYVEKHAYGDSCFVIRISQHTVLYTFVLSIRDYLQIIKKGTNKIKLNNLTKYYYLISYWYEYNALIVWSPSINIHVEHDLLI